MTTTSVVGYKGSTLTFQRKLFALALSCSSRQRTARYVEYSNHLLWTDIVPFVTVNPFKIANTDVYRSVSERKKIPFLF